MKRRCVSLLRGAPGARSRRPPASACSSGPAPAGLREPPRQRRRRHDRQSRGPGVFPDGTGKRRLVTDRPNRGRNVVVRRSHRLPDAGRLGQRCGVATDSPSPGSTRRIIRPHLTCPVGSAACRAAGARLVALRPSLVARPRRPRRPRGEPRQEPRQRRRGRPDGRTDASRIS